MDKSALFAHTLHRRCPVDSPRLRTVVGEEHQHGDGDDEQPDDFNEQGNGVHNFALRAFVRLCACRQPTDVSIFADFIDAYGAFTAGHERACV